MHISIVHDLATSNTGTMSPTIHLIAGWVGLKTLVAGLTKSKGGSESEIPSHVDDSRCFSIVFKNKTAIHLELPVLGNGRSRAEWLDAFRDLCDGTYKSLLHPDELDES